MLYIIPIGLISTGIGSGYLTYKNYLNLKEKISLEPIYNYPEQIIDVCKNQNDKVIFKIPPSLMDSNYLIGEIMLEKLKPVEIIKQYYDMELNPISNKYEKIKKKIITVDYKSEVVKRQVLFPNIYPILNSSNNLFELKKLYELNKIKVLFNNTSTIKSANSEYIFNLYEKTIRKNITNFCSDTIVNSNSNDSFQIKKNFLAPNSNLYLLIESNSKNNSNTNPNTNPDTFFSESNIEAISDSKDTIVNYKYKNENENIVVDTVATSILLSFGVLSGLFIANYK